MFHTLKNIHHHQYWILKASEAARKGDHQGVYRHMMSNELYRRDLDRQAAEREAGRDQRRREQEADELIYQMQIDKDSIIRSRACLKSILATVLESSARLL